MLLASVGRSRSGASEVRVHAPEASSVVLVASSSASSSANDSLGEALCAKWSPTNGALALGTADRGCVLFKPDLTPLGSVPEDAREIGEVHAIDFSAGSRFLAAGGSAAGEEVVVWDLKRKRKHRAFAGHERGVTTMKYGGFGRIIGSGGGSGTIIVHDVESGATKAKLTPPTASGVNSIDFSQYAPENLVSAYADGTVRLWDTEAGQLTSTLTVRGSECYQVAFSPTTPGLVGYVKSDGRVVLQDAASPTPSGAVTFKGTQVTSMAWHYSGFALAVGTSDGRVSWLDTRKMSGGTQVSQCQLYETNAHEGGVYALAWQQPLPQSFQVESTPARGDNIPDSPMTPVADKSAGLIHKDSHQKQNGIPPPELDRQELRLTTSSETGSSALLSELSSLVEGAMEKLGSDISLRVRDLHLELLRQHQLQQEENARMFVELHQTQREMADEIAALRAELKK